MAIQVEVWGDYALFSRPEFKVEHVSYDTMTPSAARGLLESIYWHPGLRPHSLHQHSPQRGEGYHQRPQGKNRYGERARRAVFSHAGKHPAAGGHGAAGRALCD